MTQAAPLAVDVTAPVLGVGEAVRPGGRGHLHDVDVVRLTTVLGVLGVHGTSLLLPTSETSGAALTVLHTTREVFLFLSAFVLAYSARLPIVARSFWRRRFPLVVAPYLVWSAIYVLADGSIDGPGTYVARLARDLLSGAARFHLYFLLLTFQLYLVFPWIKRWLGRRSHHGRVLAVAFAWQVAFTAAIHYRLDLPAPLSAWLAHPGTWLPSYVLYVVAGVLAAFHLEALRAWVTRNRRPVAWASAVVLAAGVVSYELDVHVGRLSPLHAGEVFAPAVVVESLAAIAGQFAFGLWVAERAGERARHWLRTSSDVSFGVYLAHPLLYQGLLALLGVLGWRAGLRSLPAGVGLLVVLAVIVPALYLLTAMGMMALRRTPLSLALTGRRPPVLAAPQPASLVAGRSRGPGRQAWAALLGRVAVDPTVPRPDLRGGEAPTSGAGSPPTVRAPVT